MQNPDAEALNPQRWQSEPRRWGLKPEIFNGLRKMRISSHRAFHKWCGTLQFEESTRSAKEREPLVRDEGGNPSRALQAASLETRAPWHAAYAGGVGGVGVGSDAFRMLCLKPLYYSFSNIGCTHGNSCLLFCPRTRPAKGGAFSFSQMWIWRSSPPLP